MNTGVQSFTNPSEIGALYPFVGGEVLLVILAIILWLAWHVLDLRGEGREFREAVELYQEVGLENAMHHGGSGHIATEEEKKKKEEVNRAIHALHERGELRDISQDQRSASVDTEEDDSTSSR